MNTKQLNGSEKQIKWALDIIRRHEIGIGQKLESTMWSDIQKEAFKKRLEWLRAQESASAIIRMATESLWGENGMAIPDDED